MPTPAKRVAIIDEFGELERRLKVQKPERDRHKALEAEIVAWYRDEPAEESFVAEGTLYSVRISARAKKRTIFNLDKVFRLLGKIKFLSLASIPLSAVDRELPDADHSTFLKEERSGSRSVEAVAIVPALKRAA